MVILSILVWDAPEYTENLLKSLFEDYKVGSVPHEVYILDQGSGRETMDILKRYSDRINLIRLEKNIGFGKGHNMLYKRAGEDREFDYFCCINSDIRFEEDNWLDRLVSSLEANPESAVAGPSGLQIIEEGLSFGYGKLATEEEMKGGRFDTISGSLFIVRKAVVEKFGLFDEIFFPAYYEDTDMCLRYKKEGFKLIYSPVEHKHHYLGKKTSTAEIKSKRLLEVYGDYMERNRRIFLKRWRPEIDVLKWLVEWQNDKFEREVAVLERQNGPIIRRIQEMKSYLKNGRAYKYAQYAKRLYYYSTHPGATRDRLLGRTQAPGKVVVGAWKGLPATSRPKNEVFQEAEIKVLHVSSTSLSGAPIRLSRLMNDSDCFFSLSVCRRNWSPDGMSFDYDVVYEPTHASGEEHERIKRLIEECDIVHFHNEAYFRRYGVFETLPEGKAACLQWHNGPGDISNRLDITAKKAINWKEVPTLVIAQKNALLFKESIPVPNVVDIRLPEYQVTERDKDVVDICYAPIDPLYPHLVISGDKGSDEILETLDIIGKRYPGRVRVHILKGMPFDECLEIRRRCHICIDDIKSGGYHLSSLEGLALGSVVVANIDLLMQDFLAEYTGCRVEELPWYQATPHNLVKRLEELIEDMELIEEIGERSRAWMEQYWNHEFVLGKMKEAYGKVLAGNAGNGC